MTELQFRALKSAHDYAVTLGAECPGDCVFHSAPSRTAEEEEAPVAEARRAPDSYAEPLKALRAADATPESTFEDGWKAKRLRELDAEHARFAAGRDERHAEHLRNLEAAASYAPAPDPYAAGLKALREKKEK